MNIRQTILDLIENDEIVSQTRLRERLIELGFHVTQPTLSRLFRRLSIEKRNGVYRVVGRPTVTIPDFKLTLSPPNIIVLRTRLGHAPMLAVILDDIEVDGVAGTLAGDDTLFITTSGADLRSIATRIEGALSGQ